MFFKKKSKQTTWVYCPGCKQDMWSGEIIDCIDDGDLFVYYYCKCKTYSRWLFGIAPVPVLDKVY